MLTILLLEMAAAAGGGPANVMVLFNGEDSNAEAVAEHYAETRSLPVGHTCPVVGVDPSANVMPLEEYTAHILTALNGCLSMLPQPEEVDYLVLVRGLPYRVTLPTGSSVSLSAMIQVSNTAKVTTGEALAGLPLNEWGGVKQASIENPWYVGNSPTDPYTIENPYMGHYSTAITIASDDRQPRAPRRQSAPVSHLWEYTGNLFIVSRLDGFDYEDAWDLVDRGAAADGSFPSAPITCMAAADSARGARDPECAYTMNLLEGAGFAGEYIADHDASLSGQTLSGLLTGTTSFADGIDGNEWMPGAFAGNLTSFGAVPNNFRCGDDGVCPASESQTSIARFVRGGATFAHGTASEPLNNCFPGAGMFLLSTMGYSAIEAALMTQRFLYWQNIYLGDPLSAPWALRPVVTIDSAVPVNRPVDISATHPNGIAELRLYVDGIRVDPSAPLADSLSLSEGAEVSILAIALAENEPVIREGWPQPNQLPRPDIQGWVTAHVTLGAPTPESEAPSTEDTGRADAFTPPEASKGASSAGCNATPGSVPAAWWWICAVACGRRGSSVVATAASSQAEQQDSRQQPPA